MEMVLTKYMSVQQTLQRAVRVGTSHHGNLGDMEKEKESERLQSVKTSPVSHWI